ncbi:substrate-binding domain-containing protein [Paenibacillus alkalitolerans]|uniref:substrate-binding domain-containing protein n=1 Tax=Paenibacillus alkalitolerans TaxID=2799335 RepID=UPI0018F63059|nr:substrate-binding domain-containing protein [Paenibacillus alkalitolerans]
MSNRKWTFSIVLLFLLFAWLLLQFTGSVLQIRKLVVPLQAESAAGADTAHIVLISQELDNPFWRFIEQGAREAAAGFGMELEYTGPARINPAEQIKNLDKAIAAKADAIIVQGINDPEYRRLIDKAAGLGIPVVTVDTDEPDSRRLAYVGTDNLGAGRQMGELVAEASGKQGSIGVLISHEKAENQRLRLDGFRSVIDRYPGLEIVEAASSDISRLQAAQRAQNMLSRHPQIQYMVGFSSLDGLGIIEAAQRVRPAGVRIFGFDDLPETVKAVQACRIEATIVQRPVEMGFKAVQLLNGYFQGETPRNVTFTESYVLKAGSPDAGAGGDCR